MKHLLGLAVLSLLVLPAQAQRVSCDSGCRGLGVEKVKAGDEHCGFLPRTRKDKALDAACELAEINRAALLAHAEEEAVGLCGEPKEREGCRCSGEIRRWENIYTHLLSQNCWTECGWAYILDCERVRDTGEEEQEGNAGDSAP